MKIIRRGDIRSEQPVQATCPNCHTIVEFLPSESGVDRVTDPRDGDFYRLSCPVCFGTITKSVR